MGEQTGTHTEAYKNKIEEIQSLKPFTAVTNTYETITPHVPAYEAITPQHEESWMKNLDLNIMLLEQHEMILEDSIRSLIELEKMEAKAENKLIHSYKCYCCFDYYPRVNATPHAQIITDIYKEIDHTTQTALNHIRCSCCFFKRKN